MKEDNTPENDKWKPHPICTYLEMMLGVSAERLQQLVEQGDLEIGPAADGAWVGFREAHHGDTLTSIVLLDKKTTKRKLRQLAAYVHDQLQIPQPHARVMRVLELFQFLLPPKVRREVYEPAFNDLLEDFLIKARSYNSKWECRWLKCCLIVRAGWMVAGSLWAMCGSIIAKGLLAFVPEPLRKYLGK